MRFVELNSQGQFLASYPPANYSSLNNNDLDFSSSGPLSIPGTTLFVTGGKDGVIYVFNSANMSNPVQSFQATGTSACSYTENGCDQIHDIAFWNNTLYVWGSSDILRAYTFNPTNNQFATTPTSQNNVYQVGYHPAAMAVSGNGTQSGTGILWAVTPVGTSTPPMLHAFDASNVASELWNSNQNSGRDGLPTYPRFVEPTVTNGRVYVATHSDQVAIYGLLSDFTIAASAPTVTAYQGGSGTVTIDITSLTGSSAPTNLAVLSGLPPGATATFNQPSVTGSSTSILTIATTSATPTGAYNLLISGTRAGETRSASVALTVTTADTVPPQWTCCSYSSSGSSTVLNFSAWDTQSGLKSIDVVQVVGATISIPPFTAGTSSVVSFSATESGWSSYVKFRLTDEAGNISYIDPAFLDATREPGRPVSFGVKDVTPAEGIITIQNGSPGLKNARIEIDDGAKPKHIEVAGLKDGEVKVVDIVSLLPSSGCTVTVTPLGKPGGSALFIFASGSMSGSAQ